MQDVFILNQLMGPPIASIHIALSTSERIAIQVRATSAGVFNDMCTATCSDLTTVRAYPTGLTTHWSGSLLHGVTGWH